jgi:DUF971 family protein
MEGDVMTNSSLNIHRIWQVNNYTFAIEWNDFSIHEFRLSDLQKLCPCASCVDENTSISPVDPNTILPNVQAIHIRNVGRYGLQIQFTSGCSKGIYSFDQLFQMK